MGQDVQQRLTKFWFLNTHNFKEKKTNTQELNRLGANIISKCQNIIALTDDPYCKDKLNLLISNTAELLAMYSETQSPKPCQFENEILEICRELHINLLGMPSTIHTPTDFATVSYRLALACLYILVFSASLAVGAAFGAWYFNYLTASYFMDCLVIALASIGIPGLCVGAFSYGAYATQKNPVDELFNNLVSDVDLFCSEIAEIKEEVRESSIHQL